NSSRHPGQLMTTTATTIVTTIVHTTLLAVLLTASLTARASWPISAGSGENDEVVAMETGPAGDTYVVGHFRGSIDIGGFTLISQGGQDVFIARISPGGITEWAASAGGPYDDHVHGMTLDNAENVFVAGDFYAQATFGGSDISADGEADGFVAKINNQGSWKWARAMGGSGNDRATAVVAVPGDSSIAPPVPESIVVAGRYECSAQFGASHSLAHGNCAATSSDLFLARLASTDGEFLWARDRGSAASGDEGIQHLEIDDSNRVYAVGTRSQGGTSELLSQNFSSWNGWSSSDTE